MTAISRLLPLIFIVLFSAKALSQSHTWAGIVVEEESGEGVPYAIVEAEGTGIGVTTNSEGEFSLKIPVDKSFSHFKVVCMGYRTASIPLPGKTPTSHLELILIPEGVEVSGITISNEQLPAKAYLENALKAVKQNNPQNPFTLKGFYRHYCRDGEVYGRMIEAAAEIQDRKGYKKMFHAHSDRYSYTVNQLRRSYDYSSLYTREHAPISLPSIPMNDLLAQPSYLNDFRDNHRKLNKNLTFQYGNSTLMDGRPVQVIEYFEKEGPKPRLTGEEAEKSELYSERLFLDLFGKVYIDAENLAILGFEETHLAQYQFLRDKAISDQYFHRFIRYRKIGEHYYPHRIQNTTSYKSVAVRPNLPDSLFYNHWVNIDFQVNEVDANPQEIIPYRELDYFVLKEVPYIKDFWEDFNTIRATPLEDSIVHDLERKLDLNTQFETFHERETRDAFDSTASATFQAVRERYPDRPAYLLFWQLADSQTIYEPKFKKAFHQAEGSGIPTFRINLDMENEGYELAKIMEKRNRTNSFFRFGGIISIAPITYLRGGYGIRSALAQQFSLDKIPTLVILEPNKEPLIYTGNLSDKALLKTLKQIRKRFTKAAKAEQKARRKKEKAKP